MPGVGRRDFIALGAGGAFAAAFGAVSDPTRPLERMKSLDLKASTEDNLISRYLQPTQISLEVGAEKPFTALHFSDTHVSMMDPADLLSVGANELRLYEIRQNGVFGHGGMPFAVQSLAATLAYAKRRGFPMLNTGDLFDFRSEANIACIAHCLAGANIFSSLGNHEGYGFHTAAMNPRTSKDVEALRARYEKAIGNPLVVASRVINGVNFVAFDNCEMSRFVRDKQFGMVKAELEKGLPTVLMCHKPPYSRELCEKVVEVHRERRIGYRPEGNNLNAYFMLGEDARESKAPAHMKRLLGYLAGCENLKAMLCGHLHFEWRGTFNGKVPVVVAGRSFNGECYEISFS